MKDTQFKGAIAVLKGRDFSIRLSTGLTVVWWNENLALADEARLDLLAMLEELSKEHALLPNYNRSSRKWLASNLNERARGKDDPDHKGFTIFVSEDPAWDKQRVATELFIRNIAIKHLRKHAKVELVVEPVHEPEPEHDIRPGR